MGGGFKKIDGPRLHLGPLALLPFMLTAAAVFLLQPADRPVFETGRRADVVDASERHRPSAASLALVGYSGDPPPPPYFSFFFFTHAPSAHVTMCCCTQRCRQPSWSTPTQCIHCGAQAVQSQRTGAKLTGGGL